VAHAYHDNRAHYFEHQRRVTAEHVIPFIEESGPIPGGARVLEIGCGEAGVLEAFLQRGACAVGVDRNEKRLARGREFLSRAIATGRLTLLHQDAHTLAEHEYAGSFDLIVLKDVIEHVHDRPALFALMARLLRPGGRVFLSFPPWRMPFGGHQQVCKSWLLSRLPYFHLLPPGPYRSLLSAFHEKRSRIDSLLDTHSTGIGTAEFEALVHDSSYRIESRRYYLFNPMYTYRFGIRPLQQAGWVASAPELRDFVTTCAYYTIAPRAESALRAPR
jgi:SAM-dependent methyltransferase